MITIYSILFFYLVSAVVSKPLIERLLKKQPVLPNLEFASRILPYFPILNTIFLLNYLRVLIKDRLIYISSKRMVNKILKKHGLPLFKPKIKNHHDKKK